MKRSALRLILIVTTFILSLLLPNKVLATSVNRPVLQNASSSKGCYSLDVVFLIDQSSSMSGYGGAPASDPKEQRKYAVEAVIDQLADIALDRCPDTKHRIAVISYGTDAQVDLQFSNIDPTSFEDAERIRELLKQDVSAKDMTETQPKLAFELATEIFDELPLSESNEIRKRVIVFITDGIPYGTGQNAIEYVTEMQTQISGDLPFNDKLLEQEQCLDDLREDYEDIDDAPAESINACLEVCPAAQCDYQNSTYIWMILLKSYQMYPRGLLDIYAEIANSHAGELIELSQNRQEIPTTFRRILSELAGVKAALLQCGKFAVNPYLRKATLNIYKLDEDLSVTLSYIDTDGTKHEITQGESNTELGFDLAEYYTFGTNERYVFNYPYPGLWDLRADDCSGLDAFYEEVKIDAGYEHRVPSEIAQYDREPYYDREQPFYMEIQMLDESGSVIEQADHQRFHIDVIMTVTMPNDVQESYRMEWVTEDSIFKAEDPMKIPIPGTYSIDISGSTYKHEGEPAPLNSDSYSEIFSDSYELFRLEGAELIVFPVTPFKLEILSPQDGENLGPVHETLLQDGWNWPLPVNPVHVQARIVDANGDFLSAELSDILIDPERALTAAIAGADSTEVTLIPDPSTPGLYEGDIIGFDDEGPQRLVVSLQSEYNNHFRPISRTEEVQFTRADSLLSQTQFYKTVLYAIIAVIFLRIIICIISSSNPVRGRLVFFDGTSEIATYPLGVRKLCGKNKRTIKKKELATYPQLGLRKIQIKNQRRLGRKQRHESKVDNVADMFTVKDAANSHPGVSIKCWPSPKGRPYSVDLQPNALTPYGDIGVIQVKYIP